MSLFSTLLAIIGAYLLGAVPVGLLVARLYGIPDIRSHGSGNIGATNVWRVAGPKAAFWVFALDIGKGIAAVLLAGRVNQTFLAHDLFLISCAVAVIVGHVFPIYLRFKGGKGVNTALGSMVVLLPIETLVSVAVFFVIAVASRYISLASIAATVTLPVTVIVERELLSKPVASIYLYAALLLAVLVLVTHHQNIQRLLAGSENRFSFSSGGVRRDDDD